jgi:hypothetical protein
VNQPRIVGGEALQMKTISIHGVSEEGLRVLFDEMTGLQSQ